MNETITIALAALLNSLSKLVDAVTEKVKKEK